MSEEKPKTHWLLALITSLGVGGSGGAAISYYAQDTQAKAIEKLDDRQIILERMLLSELREMNTRLSRIEGRLEGK